MIQGVKPQIHEERSVSEAGNGFVQAWIDGHFHVLENGTKAFYPLGPMGRKGYVVSSTQQELVLRLNVRGARRLLMGVLISFMLVFIFSEMKDVSWISLGAAGFALLMEWVVLRMYFWRFTRSMEPVDIPNSFIAYARSMGRTVHPMSLALQTMALLAMTGALIVAAYRDQDPYRLLLSLVVAMGLVPYAIAWWSWLRLWIPDRS